MTSNGPKARAMRVLRDAASRKFPDWKTSRADARIALCLAMGVAIEDIDPAKGSDYSRRAFENVRASWQRAFAEDPESAWLERNYLQARANWRAHRPEWDGDWSEVSR